MDEDKKLKVMELIQEASKPARKPRTKRPSSTGTTNNISAIGDGAQAAGRDIHNNHYAQPPRQPSVKVTPGEGCITEEQKVQLTALRD